MKKCKICLESEPVRLKLCSLTSRTINKPLKLTERNSSTEFRLIGLCLLSDWMFGSTGCMRRRDTANTETFGSEACHYGLRFQLRSEED